MYTLHIAVGEPLIIPDDQGWPLHLIPVVVQDPLCLVSATVQDEVNFGCSGVVGILQHLFEDSRARRIPVGK